MEQKWSFSPRNGEVILKEIRKVAFDLNVCFSPRNGEVILKLMNLNIKGMQRRFQSP